MYRGEPERYIRVSSSLYREYPDIEAERFNIEVVQQEILDEAKRFIRETNEDFILEQLQHFGYPTNQIDFTKDYHIALFFACDSQPEKDGRVVLLKKDGRDDLKEPNTPENRIIAQKSIFVRPPKGFVEPDGIVVIPKDLKQSILRYLDKSHGVNAPALFNDIHGFITYYATHENAYEEFYAGLTHLLKKEFKEAIERFSKAISINPQQPSTYNNRGVGYYNKGDYVLAIQDFDKAIELNPSDPETYSNRGCVYFNKGAYNISIGDFSMAIALDPESTLAHFNRGLAWLWLKEWGNAESDLSHAQRLGFEIDAMFRVKLGSIEDFEQRHEIQLPENIKAMLTPEQ